MTEIFLRREASLSDSNHNASFSFQLSESEPPVETRRNEKLAPLSFDLSELKEEALGADPGDAGDAGDSLETGGESPFSPLAPLVSAKPRIKKIQFPASSTVSSTPSTCADGPGTPSHQAPLPKKRLKTHFSKSMSAETIRTPLDSEPDRESDEFQELISSPPDLATPEDLPSPRDEFAERSGEWGTETPTAQEIWLKARRAWGSTSRHALHLGAHGIRAGRDLAQVANQKLKRGLLEAKNHKTEQAPRESSPELHDFPHHTHALSATRSLGEVAWTLTKGTGKRLAAPFSALAAAGLVYWGGTQLLGTAGLSTVNQPGLGGTSLSHTVHGPEIPHLGSLEDKEPASPKVDGKKTGDSSFSPPDSESESQSQKKKTAAPPAMQVEVTEMPQGLSWPGKGLIEVVTSEEELIYIDGVFTGRGPLRRIPVSPGEHKVSIRTGGKNRSGKVQVRLNKSTRAVFTNANDVE